MCHIKAENKTHADTKEPCFVHFVVSRTNSDHANQQLVSLPTLLWLTASLLYGQNYVDAKGLCVAVCFDLSQSGPHRWSDAEIVQTIMCFRLFSVSRISQTQTIVIWFCSETENLWLYLFLSGTKLTLLRFLLRSRWSWLAFTQLWLNSVTVCVHKLKPCFPTMHRCCLGRNDQAVYTC